MFGFIEREHILLKQNIYDLLDNTRIGKTAFLFILIGVFLIYVLGNIDINREAVNDEYWYYIRYFYKLLGVCIVYDLCRRRLHDFGLSSNWLILWLLIGGSIYAYYFLSLYSAPTLPVRFFERILLAEIGILFIPTVLLYFLPTDINRNQFGDSKVQMISSACTIGYVETKITLNNEKGILEYLRDIYVYQSFKVTG